MYFANKPSEQIMEALRSAGRLVHDINHVMRTAIGLRRESRHHKAPFKYVVKRPWTSEEVALLSQRRSDRVPTWEIATELNRSIYSVENKIRKSWKQAWSAQETKSFWQLIEENKPHEEIARELGRSVFAIRGKLNFSKRGTATHKWTAEHKAMLAEYFRQGLNDGEIANALPFETTLSRVAIVRRRMGLTSFRNSTTLTDWTCEDDMQVRQFFAQGMNDSAIGTRLSPRRTASSVKKRRCTTLKLIGPSRTFVPWSDLEVEEMYRMVEQGLSNTEISKQLSGGSRTVHAIANKRKILNLVRFHRENAQTLKDRDPSKSIRPDSAAKSQEETIKSEQLL